MVESPQEFLEGWKGQVTCGGTYFLCLFLAAHALLGIVRTVSVQYPARFDNEGLVVPLFSGDYTFKLDSWSGWWARMYKVFTLTLVFLLFAGGLVLTLLRCMTLTDYVWLEGWNKASAPYVLIAHAVFIVLVLALAVRRGYTYAIHWSKPPRANAG